MPLRQLWFLVGATVAAALKKISQPLRLVGAEPDDSAWLTPGLVERIPHVTDGRLDRRLPYALKRSPSLPG